MNADVRRLVGEARERATHRLVRERLDRCSGPQAGFEELYAASREVLHLTPSGHVDARLCSTLADAINLAIQRDGRTGHLDRIVAKREVYSVPIATRARPALLAFERDGYDGKERDATVVLPPDAKEEEPSEQLAEAFFKARAAPPRRPEASGRRVALVGDSSLEPRRVFREEVVTLAAENIAMLARHRVERPQRERAENEEALLAQVDAIGASGGECVRLVIEWWREAKDPWKTWAAVFSLASLAGVDSLQAIARELEAFPVTSSAHVETAAEALVVAPHPDVSTLARDLVESPNPIARGIGVEALGRRGLLAPEDIERHLCDANLPVLSAALRVSDHLPSDTGPRLLLPYLRHPEHAVAWPAARQLALWGRSEPYHEVRRGRCQALGTKALEILVQYGDLSDLDAIDEILAREPPSPATISAVARFGHAGAWAYLVHQLEAPELVDAAARGLRTLFGALVPAKEERTGAAWRSAIGRARLDLERRYRRGEPWTARSVAAECVAGDVDLRELGARVDELTARVGVRVALDADVWHEALMCDLHDLLQANERAEQAALTGWWRRLR